MEHRKSMNASTSGRGLESGLPRVFTPGRCHKRQTRILRDFEHLCRGMAREGTKSRAIAITWEDLADSEELGTGEWGESGATAQARPDIRPASVLPASRAKPLRINRDLLLVSTTYSRVSRECEDQSRLDQVLLLL